MMAIPMSSISRNRGYHKALLVATAFAIAGVISALIATPHPALLLFYVTIAINTYYSVMFFAPLTPHEHAEQHLIDTVLAIWYVLMAATLSDPYSFTLFSTALFLTAVLKYEFLRLVLAHGEMLTRKIMIDIGGAALSAAAFAGVVFADVNLSVWAFAVVFVIANIYLLYVKPMYRI